MAKPVGRDRPLPPADRKELAWTAAVAAAAAAAFATTLSSHVALGDAPESVVGIATNGILHAPGYPVYVVAARLFTWAIPFGTLAWRVNLFSLVCAALAVAGVFRTARLLGASRPGAAIGGLTLALGTSFWFYADFAKHDAFSFLLVVTATVLVLEWEQRRDLRLLIAGCAVLGLTAGASWQLGALAIPGLLTVIVLGRGRVPLARLVATAAIAGAVTSVVVLGYLMVRAGQQPTINWGYASTPGRLVDLLDMKDFRFVNQHLTGEGNRNNAGGAFMGAFFRHLWTYPGLLTRELGAAALVAAAWAAIGWRRLLASRHATFLAVSFVVGVLGTAVTVAPSRVNGFTTNLQLGGFFSGLFATIAIAVALGVTDLATLATSRSRPRSTSGPLVHRPGPAVIAGALAAILLVGSSLAHVPAASHRQPPFADDYAANVLRSLPPNAAILTRGAELTFSLLYAQRVKGERRDVTVVASDALAASSWYREELSHSTGIRVPDLADEGAELVAVAHLLANHGPVYMDMLTTDALRPALGYVALGLVSQVVSGAAGPRLPPSLATVEQQLDHGYLTAGVYGSAASHRWPNTFLLQSYVRAHLELARDYNQLAQLSDVATQVHMALLVDPHDPTALGVLKALTAAQAEAPVTGLPGRPDPVTGLPGRPRPPG